MYCLRRYHSSLLTQRQPTNPCAFLCIHILAHTHWQGGNSLPAYRPASEVASCSRGLSTTTTITSSSCLHASADDTLPPIQHTTAGPPSSPCVPVARIATASWSRSGNRPKPGYGTTTGLPR